MRADNDVLRADEIDPVMSIATILNLLGCTTWKSWQSCYTWHDSTVVMLILLLTMDSVQ
jgi:hypothetical protein